MFGKDLTFDDAIDKITGKNDILPETPVSLKSGGWRAINTNLPETPKPGIKVLSDFKGKLLKES